ncbi:hypothetical protein Nepgr_017826 [Nepenthes gracilis]|uniref:Dolichol-phosphate mannose synthase subunit 3 n=1 Tax=Nepenthes gracilis TaxID=150966 RepID=A0AAD3SS65_NEPGR|nr:hypothetical protein Nepgr_017826 [Nepenthes gracilis]
MVSLRRRRLMGFTVGAAANLPDNLFLLGEAPGTMELVNVPHPLARAGSSTVPILSSPKDLSVAFPRVPSLLNEPRLSNVLAAALSKDPSNAVSQPTKSEVEAGLSNAPSPGSLKDPICQPIASASRPKEPIGVLPQVPSVLAGPGSSNACAATSSKDLSDAVFQLIDSVAKGGLSNASAPALLEDRSSQPNASGSRPSNEKKNESSSVTSHEKFDSISCLQRFGGDYEFLVIRNPMKHILKIFTLLSAISAFWIGLLQASIVPRSYTFLLPIYLIVLLGCYGLLMVGIGLMQFPTCPQEATLLQQDIAEAKDFLKGKGVDVGSD